MNPATHTPTRLHRRVPSPGTTRGFTLIELMTVVVIIGIFSAIALPSVVNQLRERKSANVAQQITQFYRMARMRAAGRGSAVLVRYDADGKLIAVREAVAGVVTGNKCALSPIASCTAPANRWDDPTLYRELELIYPFNNTEGSEYELTRLSMLDGANTVKTKLDICFTPGGRTFVRDTFGDAAFSQLNYVPTVRVWSQKGADKFGPERSVYVLPNGIARVNL